MIDASKGCIAERVLLLVTVSENHQLSWWFSFMVCDGMNVVKYESQYDALRG